MLDASKTCRTRYGVLIFYSHCYESSDLSNIYYEMYNGGGRIWSPIPVSDISVANLSRLGHRRFRLEAVINAG
jgi:hypothetical protein